MLAAGCGGALPQSAQAAYSQEASLDGEDVQAEPEEFVPAEVAPEDRGNVAARVLWSGTIEAPQDGEGTIALTARAIGADWAQSGRESAVISLFVDGIHNQDIILARGDSAEAYQALLGHLTKGSHRIEARFRPDLSPAGARGAEVSGAATKVHLPGDPEFDAIAGAPIVFARPDSNRSDLPLFLTYARLETGLQYTMYLSNEDGGTPTADLMAVWGRAADIDWIYRRSGTGHGGYYQGFLHRTLQFRGRYEDAHPVLRVATKNGMVSDQGTSRFKLRLPILAAPAGARESAFDMHPWAYRLTAVELAREGKIRLPGERESLMSKLFGKQVGDMRRYVTIEFEHPANGDRIGYRVQVTGETDWHTSIRGRFHRAIKRAGRVRTTIELPAGVAPDQVVRVQPITALGRPYGGSVRVTKAFGFDASYRPVALRPELGFPGP
jgi:hypothetical protein